MLPPEQKTPVHSIQAPSRLRSPPPHHCRLPTTHSPAPAHSRLQPVSDLISRFTLYPQIADAKCLEIPKSSRGQESFGFCYVLFSCHVLPANAVRHKLSKHLNFASTLSCRERACPQPVKGGGRESNHLPREVVFSQVTNHTRPDVIPYL